LAQNVVSTLKPTADKMNITLETTFSKPQINAYLDSDRITQVFMNLLSNALKFTRKKGLVNVSIEEKEGQIKCSIADTGIGIAPENVDKLFMRYQKFGSKVAPKQSGAGLGLAITKEIIEMHNGQIWVESKLKKGSKFIFIVPKRITQRNRKTVAVEQGGLRDG